MTTQCAIPYCNHPNGPCTGGCTAQVEKWRAEARQAASVTADIPGFESEPIYVMGVYVGEGKVASASFGLPKDSFESAPYTGAGESVKVKHSLDSVAPASALDTQVGGDHYKKLAIQPMQYSMANKLDACQHTAIKYITRFRDKGGVADLEKAKHVIDMLIEFESRS